MGQDRLSPPQLQVRSLRLPLALLYWAIGGLLVACLALSATGQLDTGARLGAVPGAPLLAAALATHTPTPIPAATVAPTGVVATPARSIVPTFTPTPAALLPTVTPLPPAAGLPRLPTPTPSSNP